MFCGHVATLTQEKHENLGPVIHENIIAEIAFTCCSAKISYRKIFSVYGTQFKLYNTIQGFIQGGGEAHSPPLTKTHLLKFQKN